MPEPLQLHPDPPIDNTAKIDLLDEKLSSLVRVMALEIEERQEGRERRAKMLTRYVLPAVLAVATGGGIGGYRLSQGPSDAATAAGVIGDALEEQSGVDTVRAKELEERVQVLGERSVAHEVLVTESVQYLGEKIDKLGPRQAGAVAKPSSLVAAEKRVEKIKRAKAVDEIFAETDSP